MAKKRVEEKKPEANGVSKFKTVILAAKRALEISGGAQRLVEIDPRRKAAIVALKEIAEGKISMGLRKKEKE